MPANDYYDSTGAPSTSSTISSSTLRAEFDAIETGFTAVQTALGLKATSLLTGYTSAAGTVAATDTILQAIQKLNGNDATNANLIGPVTSVGNATAIADAALSIAKTSGLQTALDAKATKLTWTIKTTTYTAVAGDAIMADTNSAAFTITLPASPAANDVVDIADYRGTFGTNNLTIARNSLKIMGLSEDMVVSVSNARFRLVYIDTTVGWRIV